MKKGKTKIAKERGITLISLIVTIIVLVILASITIRLLTDGGALDQAQGGKNDYLSAEEKENEILGNTGNILEKIVYGDDDDTPTGGDEDTKEDDDDEPEENKEEGLTYADLKVGDYIAYEPESGTFTIRDDYSGVNGSGSVKLSTETGTTWRVLAVNSVAFTLISTDVTNSVGLSNYNGYNNGVIILNEACEAMYSNYSFYAIARSINIEDIEAVSSYDCTKSQLYGQTVEYYDGCMPTGYSNGYYPNIFSLEKTGIVDGVQGTKYNSSKQSLYITGQTHASDSITLTTTLYTYKMSTEYMLSIYYALFTCQTGDTGATSHDTYWLATRYTNCDAPSGYFGLQTVDSGWLSYTPLSLTDSMGDGDSHALRPVVTIYFDEVIVGETGSGESNDAYSIRAK